MEKGLMIGSENTKKIVEMFGLEREAADERMVKGPELAAAIESAIKQIALEPGTLTLIGGASGSGKSSLLRALRGRQSQRVWIDVDAIEPDDSGAVVDCFGCDELEHVLAMLGGVGLGEVWTYLRKPCELSEGQQLRLKLALAMWELRRSGAGGILAADEFGAVLDRVTAKIVAKCLRREMDKLPGTAVVVATGHGDLQPALEPHVMVHCDFGKIVVKRRET